MKVVVIFFLFFFASFLAASPAIPPPPTSPPLKSETSPEHVHIAYGNTLTEILVSWSTSANSSSVVRYGLSPGVLNQEQTGSCFEFTEGNPLGRHHVHRVRLEKLVTGTTYWYQVVSDGSPSAIFNFTTMREGRDWVPHFLVYGDMGRFGGAPSLGSLIRAVHSPDSQVTAIIHVGDFAYDLDTLGGINGDLFMTRIEPLAAYVPYMTCVGNHELAHNYSHYRNRFFMPGAVDVDNMWYSWDVANIHFVAYSTEVYFQSSPVFTPQRQLDWLRADLRLANQNRDQRPWVIAYGHRPFYCSNSDHDDCTTARGRVRKGLEELFYEEGVDVIIEAHEHSYERLWPVFNETVTQFNYTNPMAPVHIISGAAGCNENDGVCVNPIPGPRGPWSAFRSSGKQTYGYGRMFAANDTHLYWEEILATEGDKVLDSIWIEQHNHGPFRKRPIGKIVVN